MESPSAPAHRGHVPWQGLLLAVSLLSFRSLPTTAQLTIASVNATEGKDVLLLVLNLSGSLRGYVWFRGESVDNNRVIATYEIATQNFTPGPVHSGRETIYPNGSLLLQKVTLNDTGNYTIQIIKGLLTEAATGQLRVYTPLPKPNITSNNSNPEEHKDPVLLTCEPETQDTTYLWLINSQHLQDSARLELSKDNRTLTLLHVTRTDTGPYECETRNPVSAGRSDPFSLNVLYGPDAPSISPPDSHYPPGAKLNLTCHAASNPPAQYSWLINGRPQQPIQKLFIPSITANDSGSYTCIAHNSVTGLNRTTVKNITVTDVSTSATPGLSGGAIAGIVIGVLALVALIAALVYFLYIRKTGGYDGLSSCPAFSRANCRAWRDKDFPLLLWAWICSASFPNPCFSALIPAASSSLVFKLPVPHSFWDMVIPIPIWFREADTIIFLHPPVRETRSKNKNEKRSRRK